MINQRIIDEGARALAERLGKGTPDAFRGASEAVLRAALSGRSDPAPSQQMTGTLEDHNAAFDAANEALGGAFMAGFREGWIYAEIDADGERYQQMAEEYALAVDSASQEAWDAHRAGFFAMLPLSAIPEVKS